jgi:hypothetical protein
MVWGKGRMGPAWNWGEEEGKRGWGGQGGEITQIMYAHVNKWTTTTKKVNNEKKQEEALREVTNIYIKNGVGGLDVTKPCQFKIYMYCLPILKFNYRSFDVDWKPYWWHK